MKRLAIVLSASIFVCSAGWGGLDQPGNTEELGYRLTDRIFFDDFECGNTHAWSEAIPPGTLGNGDGASLRDVVINEINWFGNTGSSSDEWIELRNISGGDLNLSEWTIDNAGTGANSITLALGTVVPDGGYMVIGRFQGPDIPGSRTSLTGVDCVQLQLVNLSNTGEELILRDVFDDAIDFTPVGAWPAGDNDTDESMERRDEITGGGYIDGSNPVAWYTWNSNDGRDTTNPETSDSGTPGAANTDPDL